MTTVRLRPAIALLAALWATSTLAQTKPSPWFPIPPDATFETGDTWTDLRTPLPEEQLHV